MKVMTILGTRPEIIRLSLIIQKLDRFCQHVLVHTGQNYDVNLSEIFFRQLGLRKPDYTLGAKGSFGVQAGQILARIETVFLKEKPDAVLILGDTNSGLTAIVAKKLGIPVFHMEAGNRCFDDRVPEEVNRRLIDHSSTLLMPYTSGSRDHLLREGIPTHRIHVTGNPIWEVITHHKNSIDERDVLKRLKLTPKKYFLATLHRQENVDEKERLKSFMEGLTRIQKKFEFPILLSLHPRTKEKMSHFKISAKAVTFVQPLNFFDFVALEKEAFCTLSDSGTVQEECCLMHVPTVTLRDVTERPETIDCGSNILSGMEPSRIVKCVEIVTTHKPSWDPPKEYLKQNVSETVLNILLGYNKLAYENPPFWTRK